MVSKSRITATGGMLLALEAVLLILLNFVPVNTLFIMAVASLISSIFIIEYGEKKGVLFSLASIAISFLIISNKFQWILFSLTFAIYGSVKAFIEMGRGMTKEWTMKLVFANVVFAILYFIMRQFIADSVNPLILLAAGNVAFVIYDIVYSQFIVYYEKNIRKHIKKYFG